MIHVTATISLKSGRREEYLEILKRNVPAVRAEEGCIAYEPAVDVDSGLRAQGGVRENVVTVVETWASVEAVQAHLATPHMVALKEEVKDIVEGVELIVVEPA